MMDSLLKALEQCSYTALVGGVVALCLIAWTWGVFKSRRSRVRRHRREDPPSVWRR